MSNKRAEMFKGLHHVGLTVANVDQSMDFYERLLGRLRDFIAEGEGEELSRAVGVKDARVRFGFISMGATHLELIEYRNQRKSTYELGNNDVGACHVCFEVNNLEDAMNELESEGIRFYSTPLDIQEGPLAGCRFVYFDDPDGITLELFSVPRD